RRLDRRIMAFAALPDGWHQHVLSLGAPARKHVARGAVFPDRPRILAPRSLRAEAMAEVAELTVAEPSLGAVRRGDPPSLLRTLDVMAVPATGRGPEQDAVGILDLPVNPVPLPGRLHTTTRPSRYGASDPSVVALQVVGVLADELRITLPDQPTQQFGL